MVSSHPAWSQAFSQSTTNNSLTHRLLLASTLSFALIFFVISFITFILCCRSNSSLLHRAFMNTLHTLQVIFSEPRENSCPTIFSHLSYSVLPFQHNACLLLSSTLYLSMNSSSIVSTSFSQHWSISSWLIDLRTIISSVCSAKELLGLFFASSMDHPFTFLFF